MLHLRRRIPGIRCRQSIRWNGQLSGVAFCKKSGAPVDVHPEVEDALARKLPVVSLETALVTHGIPYPASLEVSLAMEEAVRSSGAIPATIGLVGGRVKIGLEKHELDRLALGTHKSGKISRRDIAAAIATQHDGGTTCSATLVFSALAGIKVFATGGLGGVHRGGENSMDVSADLQELSRCPVGLVSSGCKSILDIKRTLEYLESAGVPVVSYGPTKEFPAFFTRRSGLFVPWNVADPATAANIIYTQTQLGLSNGVLLAVPIPEGYEAAGEKIQQFVNQAVQESEENGVARSGNDATPWLLARVLELSKGKSLESNTALLINNALVGGQIAVQYAKLAASQGQSSSLLSSYSSSRTIPLSKDTSSEKKKDNQSGPVQIAVVGAAALDITARADPSVNAALAPHSTIPGSVSLTLGGVARNIAEATSRATTTAYPGIESLLVSPVGEDLFGHILAGEITRLGMRNDGLIVVPKRTAVCNMVLDSEGALVGGVADMDITTDISPELASVVSNLLKHSPKLVAFDGNLHANTIQALVQHCTTNKAQSLFEPTSVYKSTRILPAIASWLKKTKPTHPLVTHFTPNILELNRVYEEARAEEFDIMSDSWWWDNVNSLSLGSSFRTDVEQLSRRNVSDRNVSDDNSGEKTLSFLTEQGTAQMAVHLLPFFQHIWIKCGGNGVVAVMQISPKDAASSSFVRERTNIAQRTVVAHGNNGEILVLKHFPALHIDALVNVTGAGDSFVGALLAGIASDSNRLYNPEGLESIVNTAQRAACLTLESHDAVSPLLSTMAKV